MNEAEEVLKDRKLRPVTIDSAKFTARSIKAGIWALVFINAAHLVLDNLALIVAIVGQ